MMIVAADCDILSHWSNSGIVTYVMSLLEQLSQAECSCQFYVFVRRPPEQLAALASTHPNLKLLSPQGPGWMWRMLGGALAVSPLGSPWFWKQLCLTLLTRPSEKMLFFAPSHRVPLVPVVPKVVAIQDLGFELFPESFGLLQRKRMSWATRLAVRQADRIIAPSESTKRDLVNCYGCRPDRIRVVYHGYDSRSFEPSPACPRRQRTVLNRYGLATPYFLHVGVLQPRKNIVRLIDAFVRAANGNPSFNAQLAIVGQRGWKYEAIIQRATATDTKGRVVLTGPVLPDELPVLYKSALAVVMPSLYEGFGLPVLEAMACGTPVACSQGSSLGEIAGDCALSSIPIPSMPWRKQCCDCGENRR